jgi:hypothetical protein
VPETPAPQAKEVPPAPDSIDWKQTSALELGDEEFKTANVFGHFADLAGLEGTKPLMLYFYWPEEDASSDDEEIANQVRRCKLMDEILDAEPVRRASAEYHSFKVNVKDLGEAYKDEYKITFAPKIIFFDVKGRKVWQLTSTSAKAEGVAKKMVEITVACKRMLQSANK